MYLVSSNPYFPPLLSCGRVLNDYLVHSCWVLGFYKLEAKFSLSMVAKFLCSCLCLLDVIFELHHTCYR